MDKPAERRAEQRRSPRLHTVFPVWLRGAAFGERRGIARDISSSGMFIEVAIPLPIGSSLEVHFAIPGSREELVAHGEIKRHYFLHFVDRGDRRSLTGMGVRFIRFDAEDERRLEHGLTRMRTLH